MAVHKSGNYYAYAIVSPGKNTGMVRVVQKKADQRVLVKGMKGKVKDLSFAHCLDQVSKNVCTYVIKCFFLNVGMYIEIRKLPTHLVERIHQS